MSKNEKALVEEIKKTLIAIAEKTPQWRLILGRESLSAQQVIAKLDNDKKLRQTILEHYIGLAVELEQQARKKLEGQ